MAVTPPARGTGRGQVEPKSSLARQTSLNGEIPVQERSSQDNKEDNGRQKLLSFYLALAFAGMYSHSHVLYTTHTHTNLKVYETTHLNFKIIKIENISQENKPDPSIII